MKDLLEKWKQLLVEAPELPPQGKAKIFDNVEKEAATIINKVKSASGGDSELAKEAMQSLIVSLENSIESL
jgi:hypothetical protein